MWYNSIQYVIILYNVYTGGGYVSILTVHMLPNSKYVYIYERMWHNVSLFLIYKLFFVWFDMILRDIMLTKENIILHNNMGYDIK